MGVQATNDFLTDLFDRRGSKQVVGYNPIRFLELHGARIVEPEATEPDAATYRGEYYYNTTLNALYRKVVTHKEPGIVIAHWQKVSS